MSNRKKALSSIHYILLMTSCSVQGFYSSLGCFRDDDQDRAVPTMEGTHQLLKESFLTRKDAVEKCAEVTRSRGWKVFAVQDGGWCASSPTAHLTYNKYGTAINCVDGKGGMFANDVYIINGKNSVKYYSLL